MGVVSYLTGGGQFESQFDGQVASLLPSLLPFCGPDRRLRPFKKRIHSHSIEQVLPSGQVLRDCVLRRSDPAADAAWKEREHARLQRCEQVVQRLHGDGELAAAWDVPTASRCFWAVTSQRVWDDLVMDQGWSTAQYRDHITALLEAALLRRDDE